jgi:sterol desaturase/sphingolipid hydroxylase (fatty acid hydroxylase superfamily)
MLLELYKYFHSYFVNDERIFFAIMLSISHSLPTILHELFLLFLSKFGLLKRCIIQHNKSVDNVLIKKCLINFFINHFFMMPLLLGLIAYPIWISLMPVDSLPITSLDNIPDIKTIIKHLFICIIIEDFLFYWSHRILHHPLLYKRFHKKHHEFKVLTGYSIAAEYTHPVESILGNIIPVLVGPILTTCHFYTLWLWIIIRMLKTCDAHSGYYFKISPFNLCFPLNPSTRHDFHHETGLGSFGSFLLIWDIICGTDIDFKRAQHDRNKIENIKIE